MRIDRRIFLSGAGASILAGCGGGETEVDENGIAPPPPLLERVLDGAWRPEEEKARDVWRHPAETLAFFGLQPGMTVVEIWPGAGWYTNILGPFLQQSGGKLYAALEPVGPEGSAGATMVSTYTQLVENRQRLYGDIEITEFGPASRQIAPDGEADMVLSFRNVHNWIAGAYAEKAFADAFRALKPGGILGVVEHRATPGGLQDVFATTGYVLESFVIQLAREAGFQFEESSEINANPADTKDHPFGVWTLPPARLTAPRGEPADPTFNRRPYDEIGESDRMTLKFVKPGGPA